MGPIAQAIKAAYQSREARYRELWAWVNPRVVPVLWRNSPVAEEDRRRRVKELSAGDPEIVEFIRLRRELDELASWVGKKPLAWEEREAAASKLVSLMAANNWPYSMIEGIKKKCPRSLARCQPASPGRR